MEKEITEIDPNASLISSRNTEDCKCGLTQFGLTSCGDVRRQMNINRIIGGRFANENEIPWSARIVICRSRNECYVRKEFFVEISRMNVELGVRDARVTSYFTKRVGVESFSIHGEHEEQTAKNDIALVKLKQHIQFNEGIKPACLPLDEQQLFAGEWAVASGWGQTSVSDKRGSNVLKRTRLQVLQNSNQYCINGASLGKPPWIKQMCAYAEGTDSCGGDSGGPLTLPQNGRCALVGIVSYGLECALTYHAGVYTRVSEYLFWIKHLAKDGGCFGGGTEMKPKYCDMRCLWGHVTATYYITNNRHEVKCDQGICYATNSNVNVCEIYNYPCGHMWN
ncbi:unnamed protein product [Lepeophtheirus salmonis]|uniref:(salmon louse) hypothetical protein n=1 Tax=Lepeophtheirus salmonis TaxID=72036 RepID=A0A7R8HAH4_LEPSM|nr:unnamed protein product [Lepeophtheirus salmonis]CAF2967054.1 unnamed protein product [Lepeophtheirus salmonis]